MAEETMEETVERPCHEAGVREESSDSNGNGVAGSHGEYEVALRLAQTIITSPADDSLAIEHSILESPALRFTLEHRWVPYVLTWPFMMLVALWCCVWHWIYQLTVRPKGERQILGPERMTWWFDKLDPIGYQIRNGVTSSKALDAVYSGKLALRNSRGWKACLMRYWLGQPDGQAVRNRLRNTYHALAGELENRLQQGRAVRILSLACGSAQASIEALAHILKRYPRADVCLTLVDVSESSLRRAKRLAEAREVDGHLTIVVQRISDFFAERPGETWDLVEMVGFLDYRSERSVVDNCRVVRNHLALGGAFIVAAICPSPWAFVVRWVVNWPLLIRRKPERILYLLRKAGFQQDKRQKLPEPHGIHFVVKCWK